MNYIIVILSILVVTGYIWGYIRGYKRGYVYGARVEEAEGYIRLMYAIDKHPSKYVTKDFIITREHPMDRIN